MLQSLKQKTLVGKLWAIIVLAVAAIFIGVVFGPGIAKMIAGPTHFTPLDDHDVLSLQGQYLEADIDTQLLQLPHQLAQVAVLLADGVFIPRFVAAREDGCAAAAGAHHQIRQPPDAVGAHRGLKEQHIPVPGQRLRLLREDGVFQRRRAELQRALRVQQPLHSPCRLQRLCREQAGDLPVLLRERAQIPQRSPSRTPSWNLTHEKIRSRPISPVFDTCVPQHAQISAPGMVTMRTCPVSSFLLR